MHAEVASFVTYDKAIPLNGAKPLDRTGFSFWLNQVTPLRSKKALSLQIFSHNLYAKRLLRSTDKYGSSIR